MGQSLWVFDCDDTIVTSSIDYGRASLDAARLMMDALEHRAPRYVEIVNFLESVNKSSRLEKSRFMRDDFPGVLVECYRRLSHQAGFDPDPAVERQCREIGYSALSEDTYRNRGMIPGAEEVLSFVLNCGNPLFCATLGDPSVQWSKWRGYNLRRFFPTAKEFRISLRDKLATLKRLRRQYPDLPAFMVGDRVKSDVIPAYRSGLTPVYIPHPAVWDPSERTLELPPGTIKLARIDEIVDLFR